MSLVAVDPDKCIYCGRCLEECPFALLEMKTEDSLPTPRSIEVRSAQERCINCGHCAAVCPTAALTAFPIPHSTIPGAGPTGVMPERQAPEDFRPIRPELAVSPEQIDQLLMGRRSHRAYSQRQVPRETLEELVRVAGYAPTPHNSQLARWMVISDKDQLRRIAQTIIDFMKQSAKNDGGPADLPWDYRGTDSDTIVDIWEKGEDSIFRGAPHLIIIHGPSFLRDIGVPHLQFTINLTFLELAAYPRGLATVWIGFLMIAAQSWRPTIDALGLPEGQELYGSMAIGYPKNTYSRIPSRREPEINWR
jgi:nitroreductase/ferredoxin